MDGKSIVSPRPSSPETVGMWRAAKNIVIKGGEIGRESNLNYTGGDSSQDKEKRRKSVLFENISFSSSDHKGISLLISFSPASSYLG